MSYHGITGIIAPSHTVLSLTLTPLGSYIILPLLSLKAILKPKRRKHSMLQNCRDLKMAVIDSSIATFMKKALRASNRCCCCHLLLCKHDTLLNASFQLWFQGFQCLSLIHSQPQKIRRDDTFNTFLTKLNS